MPVDYSKWKDIEISDDEDDTHPNIDTPSLFRWRHQARLERMAELQKIKKEAVQKLTDYQQKMNDIKKKIADSSTSDAERMRLEAEMKEIENQEVEWRKKEEEIEKKERLQPWNVDTISRDGFSKSRINKVQPLPKEENLTEEEKEEKMRKFVEENRSLIKQYGMLQRSEDTKQFLLEHPHLCSEHTANCLVIDCLNYEIEGKHELMEHVAHQLVIMQYLLELATQLNVDPKASQLISSFFSKLKKADKPYHDMFEDELNSFKSRVVARAKQKLEQATHEYEEEEKKKRLGPGGLDPVEVFESLPPQMKECFEKQDIEQLKQVALLIPPEEFEYHFKRCIDSGLWVPDAKKAEQEQPTTSAATDPQTPTPSAAEDSTGKEEAEDGCSLRQRKGASNSPEK
ncbi:unnamed protein product [Soboliphyme baturini]|uniref:Hsp90 chaperone protein kinase-targeting subunit n=1 Tax=Soboliphyme baturini TaxID=241478 RepID=A0A183IMN0_9BILA|nr:unnamed protein product [Soboliphyme baturini]